MRVFPGTWPPTLSSLRILCGTLRRLLLVSAVFGTAGGDLRVGRAARRSAAPIGEASLPRVRAGVITIPAAPPAGRHPRDRPPLAAAARRLAEQRQPRFRRPRRSGSTSHSASSRAYLAQLARRQAVVAAQVRAAIPQARIQEHFSILLDGFTVQLPARALPRLLAAQLGRQGLSEPHLHRARWTAARR